MSYGAFSINAEVYGVTATLSPLRAASWHRLDVWRHHACIWYWTQAPALVCYACVMTSHVSYQHGGWQGELLTCINALTYIGLLSENAGLEIDGLKM